MWRRDDAADAVNLTPAPCRYSSKLVGTRAAAGAFAAFAGTGAGASAAGGGGGGGGGSSSSSSSSSSTGGGGGAFSSPPPITPLIRLRTDIA